MDGALWSQIDNAADELDISRSEWLREAARNKLQTEAKQAKAVEEDQ